MMISFSNTVRIDRPVADVYAYLSDLQHIPEWNWAITETTKTTPGPITVGTRYRQTRSTPRPATETLEITELDTNRHIRLCGTLAQLEARITYDLTELEGGTEVTNNVNLQLEGSRRLAAPVLRHAMKQAVASNLDDLKTRLETTTP